MQGGYAHSRRVCFAIVTRTCSCLTGFLRVREVELRSRLCMTALYYKNALKRMFGTVLFEDQTLSSR
jgi:hypothetical protein